MLSNQDLTVALDYVQTITTNTKAKTAQSPHGI